MANSFCIYQEGIHPEKSIFFLDEEDVMEVCRAYNSGMESISVYGNKIDLLYSVFTVYDLLGKFATPHEAKEYFRKNEVILHFNYAFDFLKTESKDVTKEYLKKVKDGTTIQKGVKMEKTKIFISHASDDNKIVKEFVNEILKQCFEIPRAQIFCSSMDGYGVQAGKDIPDVLKEELLQSQLVFCFVSDNYKESEVCLNEMGAAWVLLEKENVIPLLLPNCSFKKLGFLDRDRLGFKVTDQEKMLVLLQDLSKLLKLELNLPVTIEHLKKFIEITTSIEVQTEINEKIEISDYERCFQLSLYPFSRTFSQTIPHLNNGIHHITDHQQSLKILKKLTEHQYPKTLWYTYSVGDLDFSSIKESDEGNVLIDGWELDVTEMWINRDSSKQNEFILLGTKGLPPFQIQSDAKGESYCAAVMENGLIISETERGNGYASINGKVVEIDYEKTEPRERSEKSHWIFLSTAYHKTRVNVDETMAFCEELDKKESITHDELRKFIWSLKRNPPVVSENL